MILLDDMAADHGAGLAKPSLAHDCKLSLFIILGNDLQEFLDDLSFRASVFWEEKTVVGDFLASDCFREFVIFCQLDHHCDI